MKKARKPRTLLEKIETEFPEFQSEVVGLAIPQLDKRISDMQKDLQDSEEHKSANEALENARKEVAELAGPYTDVKKAIGLKTKYLVSLIREKGGQ
jgi:hypothetical protein